MVKKTFYITTPIYYPSGSLHIGHVYTTTLASVIANYKKLRGYETKMLTGADEHGEKIAKKAKELNLNPQEYVDQMSVKFKDLWKKLEIDYDYFSRTTSPSHKKIVQNIFSILLQDKVIYKGFYKGLYSVEDEEFFTKNQALKKGDKYFHPISHHELKEVEEESYFFKMSLFESWLKKYLKENKSFIFPQKTVNELFENFLKKGLEDLSISRTSFSWGIPIKEDTKHVVYVWLDALVNYISALHYGLKQDQDFKKYWENGSEIVHLVGKEITRFHCLYWPIILKSLNLKMPSKIISHGWIMTLEGKMSKSKGNVVDPLKLIEKFGSNEVKYYFASQINLEDDGVFDEQIFKNVINADLSNTFGNLISRTFSMIKQNFSYTPKYNKDKLQEVDRSVLKEISKTKENYQKYFDDFKVNKGLKEAINLAKTLNGYIDKTCPWKLSDNKERLETVLNTLLQGIYTCCVLLYPVIPSKITLAMEQMDNLEVSFDLIEQFTKFDKVSINKTRNLFERFK